MTKLSVMIITLNEEADTRDRLLLSLAEHLGRVGLWWFMDEFRHQLWRLPHVT